MFEKLEKLAHDLNLPELAMERNVYAIQIRNNKLVMGAYKNTHHANSLNIYFNDNKVILEYISYKKPKYNKEMGCLAPFSKQVVKCVEGSPEEVKDYLYNNFRMH